MLSAHAVRMREAENDEEASKFLLRSNNKLARRSKMTQCSESATAGSEFLMDLVEIDKSSFWPIKEVF